MSRIAYYVIKISLILTVCKLLHRDRIPYRVYGHMVRITGPNVPSILFLDIAAQVSRRGLPNFLAIKCLRCRNEFADVDTGKKVPMAESSVAEPVHF